MKKNIIIYLLSPLMVSSITGCNLLIPNYSSKSEEKSDTTSINNASEEEYSETTTSEQYTSEEIFTPCLENSEEYLKFWNPSTYISFDISMSQEAAEFINNYQSNHDDSTFFDYYVPCTVKLTMDEQEYIFEEVGIRGKGNLSRRNCLENGNFSLNSLVHYKLKFKETFDGEEYDNIPQLHPFKKVWDDDAKRKERKNRTLFDMEKIDIKWNRNNDESKVKHAYALKLFKDNGVLAGNATLGNVKLSINNQNQISTTYEIFECIDDIFIQRHFSKDHSKGDLYKCTYTIMGPANMNNGYSATAIGAEDNTTNYHPIYDLKTNKKKSDLSAIKNLINVVNDKTSTAREFKNKIDQVLDMNSFMKYESIAYLLGNFDDMRNNANNYYLYFDNSKAYIIPYDFDRCLGAGAEGRADFMTNFSPESTKMQCNGNWQTNNLYWRTICSSTSSSSGHNNVERIETYRALYQKNIEDILNNKILSVESFTSYVNSFPESYRGNPNGAGSGNTTISDYLNKKIQAILDSNEKGLINYNINL